MADKDMTSLANKLQNFELFLKKQHGQEVGYGRALRDATVSMDPFIEVEVLKSLGDLHIEKGKLRKDSAEFDKAAALYAAALRRCTDPDMGQALEHRIGYMEKLSRQLLQGYTPQYQRLSPDYTRNNVLRVAQICDRLDRRVGKPWQSIEDIYTETLVSAIANGDTLLELEALKSLGDFYLEKGKETSDVSQFSKAAGMYSKALASCNDPETKLTLEHRVLYLEKNREAVRKKQSSSTSTKSMPRERSPHTEHHHHSELLRKATEPGMASVAAGTVVEERHTGSDHEYSDCLKKGESSLARADLDSAEQHFASALKVVHVRDPTAQQYQREVEPLCKLGDVYNKRGQQTGDGGDFVKAAALYNAAIARSKDKVLIGNTVIAIKEVEKSFLKCILNICHNVSQDDTVTHKKQLNDMRDQIKLEIETIDQQLDPYVHDEDDPCVREIEAKRAQAVRQLFEKIAQQRKEFISLLVKECIGLMGPPPCKYALIGLGSQATGLVTPYSDLEFAILVEEESEQCLEYFRNLTHYLHLKVVNLGETILPSLGIKSLNNFYSKDPLDNWYYDSVTPRGFAFDGSMPKASKTPLGRHGTMNEPPSELICTPSNMVSKLRDDTTLYLKEGYHLATILRNPCLIVGDQDLIDMYMGITVKILHADGGKMARQLLQETMKELNIKDYSSEQSISVIARLTDVKKDLYRFPAVAVDCLALSLGITPTTVWKTIEEMKNHSLSSLINNQMTIEEKLKHSMISPSNAHHLTVLTSISAELRLRTYIANGGQKENLSALASVETMLNGHTSCSGLQTNDEEQTNALKKVFHLPNEKQLFRYYYTAIPIKKTLSDWSGKTLLSPYVLLQTLSTGCQWMIEFRLTFAFFDNRPSVRGMMYLELCKYRLAIRSFKEALETAFEDTKKLTLLSNLADTLFRVGDYQEAISYRQQALQMYQSVSGQRTVRSMDHASSLRSMGELWYKQGNYKEAISYFEKSLQMFRSIYGEGTAHSKIAELLNNLGGAWLSVGDNRKAISYFEQALQMFWSIYGKGTAHSFIASLFNNLGGAWGKLGDHKKEISFFTQALEMSLSIYGLNTAHPRIAKSLNNLGATWQELGHYRKAISYHEQVLQIRRTIYGQGTAHPHTAHTLYYLGRAWLSVGDYRKAINYLEQALQMKRRIHSQGTSHPDIGVLLNDLAVLLNDLGTALYQLGDHRRAIEYYGEALQMKKSIHGPRTAHPDTANSLGNIGECWFSMGDYRQAISYYEQALQMYKSIHGPSIAHPDTAYMLSNVGMSWYNLGDYMKAINYIEQALQMFRSIHGQSTAHPNIVILMDNLGNAWYKLCKYRKAIQYHEKALEMNKSIHGQNTAHPDTAQSLKNLGEDWFSVGDYRKAIMFFEQERQLRRSTHGQSTPTS